jgi:hypothetical protein
MAHVVPTGYLAECFWAGVRMDDLRDVDQRIEATVAAVAGDGEPVRYLGWLLVIDDEVVLLGFEGPIATVRRVVEHAGIPFGRMLRIARQSWPPDRPVEQEGSE